MCISASILTYRTCPHIHIFRRVASQGKSSLHDHLRTLCDILVKDLNEHREVILSTIVTCASTMPDKVGVYSTLVGLLNVAAFDTGEELVNRTCAELQHALDAFDFELILTLLRFISDLVNASVLLPAALVDLLSSLLQVTSEDRAPQSRKDAFALVVLSVLPWIGRDFASREPAALQQMMEMLGGFVGARSKLHADLLQVFGAADEVPKQEDTLELKWLQVSSLQKREWVEATINRPYIPHCDVLAEALQHSLPPIVIPAHEPGRIYPTPSITFRLFQTADVPKEGAPLPPSRTAERGICEGTVISVLRSYHDDHILCAKRLIEYSQLNQRLALDFIIVEVIFGEMMRLPAPGKSELFYHVIVAELIKSHSKIPLVFALAMERIFSFIEVMDVECQSRYSRWIAHFINHFSFTFRWSDWYDAIAVADDAPKAVFVRETIARTLRLTYHQRLVKEIPEEFAGFIPEDPQPNFRYETASDECKESIKLMELIDVMKGKDKDSADIDHVLNQITLPSEIVGDEGAKKSEDNDEMLNELILDTFVLVLLKVGSRTLSHVLALIEKYKAVWTRLCTGHDAKSRVVRLVVEFWTSNPQMISVILNRLLVSGIIDIDAIVDWIFAKKTVPMFTRFFVWECLFDAIDYGIDQVKKSLSALNAALAAQREQVSEEDDGASVISVTDAEVVRLQQFHDECIQTQKNSMLVVFQHFMVVLNEHIATAERNGTNPDTPWFTIALGRFTETGRRYHSLLRDGDLRDTLNRLVFNDARPDISASVEKFSIL